MSGSLTVPSIGRRKWGKLKNVPDLSDGLVDLLMDKEREKSIFFISKIFSHLLTSWVKTLNREFPWLRSVKNTFLDFLFRPPRLLMVDPLYPGEPFWLLFSHCTPIDPWGWTRHRTWTIGSPYAWVVPLPDNKQTITLMNIRVWQTND